MERMNILFIMPDQLRSDYLSCYGADFIQTANIDSLCESGVRYRRAVSPSPICVPARASLLTGCSTIHTGVMGNTSWLRPDHSECGMPTWPELASQNGYHTEAIGKMHFYPFDINEGFHHRVIAEDKRHIYIEDDYFHYLKEHGYMKYHAVEHKDYLENKGAMISKIPAEHQVDNWVAAQTCEFLEGYDQSKPFACMVGFPGPHDPFDPPAELAGMFDPDLMPDSIPETRESRYFKPALVEGCKQFWNQVDYSDFNEKQKRNAKAYYAALVYQIDQAVGRIIETLKRKGLYDKTIIIFTSDHGEFLGDFGLIGKGYYYEPSIRVPLIVRHPRINEAIVIDQTVSLTDIFSTIMTFVGAEATGYKDSITLPEFNHSKGSRKYVFGAVHNSTGLAFMITDDRWKYCKQADGHTMLYDLTHDPLEQLNLAEDIEYKDILNRLDRLMIGEIAKNTLAANDEKFFDGTNLGAGDYGKPNFKREYPYTSGK